MCRNSSEGSCAFEHPDYGQSAAHALVPAGARISDSRVPVRRFGEIYPKLEVTFGFWIVDRLTGFRCYPILRTAGGVVAQIAIESAAKHKTPRTRFEFTMGPL